MKIIRCVQLCKQRLNLMEDCSKSFGKRQPKPKVFTEKNKTLSAERHISVHIWIDAILQFNM